MRKTMAAAALGVALMVLAGCADEPVDDVAQNSPSATASGTATGTPGTDSPVVEVPAERKAACEAYLDAQSEVEVAMLELMTKFPEAAEDPAKAQELIADLNNMLGTFETEMSVALTHASADAELTAAIESDLDALQAVSAAVDAAGDDMEKALDALAAPEMENAGVAVTALCNA